MDLKTGPDRGLYQGDEGWGGGGGRFLLTVLLKWHIMLLAVLRIFGNYAEIMFL